MREMSEDERKEALRKLENMSKKMDRLEARIRDDRK